MYTLRLCRIEVTIMMTIEAAFVKNRGAIVKTIEAAFVKNRGCYYDDYRGCCYEE